MSTWNRQTRLNYTQKIKYMYLVLNSPKNVLNNNFTIKVDPNEYKE